MLAGYDAAGFYCELCGTGDSPPVHTAAIRACLDAMDFGELQRRAEDVARELYNFGITFTVYTDREAIDRILPFDVIPRVLANDEFARIEAGVIQRVATLNAFLHDIYHDAKVVNDGVVPKELIYGNPNYRAAMVGIDVPCNTYVHICGTDLVRGADGEFLVLEDNARTPSGVSYVVENRHMMQRAFPDLMGDMEVRPVEDYGQRLHDAMVEVGPAGIGSPMVVLLSPGTFNSAYSEHIFLAREMGVPLVEGQDLIVANDRVFMKTTAGPTAVDVIYRRIDDDFLDPRAFRPDSMLGVPGLFDCYRKGNVTIANAVGTGVADNKAVYAYMPRLTKYYLDQEPILPNVQTNICAEPDALAFTLDHLDELVIKPVNESGGYGMLVGPHATRAEIEEFRAKLLGDPGNYISQPVVSLSVSPTLAETAIEPRHVDLRPFAITGRDTWVLPGGLTRVALRKGSLVVNSSQGGGSKDTWVLS
ncbi:MAG: circularly permuted type 2 ATP-grasp protein [Alphaproteobacteria bacterium]|nr:circularly permuted type 2 ATP-grasp protein [Alphaproteobacteria bacterium]